MIKFRLRLQASKTRRGTILFKARLIEQTSPIPRDYCLPQLREILERHKRELERAAREEYDRSLDYIKRKYPAELWVARLGDGHTPGLGSSRYKMWLDIFKQTLEEIAARFIQAYEDEIDLLIRKCRPLNVIPRRGVDPCEHCRAKMFQRHTKWLLAMREAYQRTRQSYPSPGRMFVSPAPAPVDPRIIAELLLDVLTLAIITLVLTRVPPFLAEKAASLVRAARPTLLTALTAVVASVIGQAQGADEAQLQDLIDQARSSSQFEELASEKAEEFIEQLLPPSGDPLPSAGGPGRVCFRESASSDRCGPCSGLSNC